jgi:hypothetical protein|tara:strand:+ start:210 stop:635 length:426 start_codon:yes stop_codon:yes gene_type:complete
MAKWALVNRENGGLSDICDEADKFEVYEGADASMKWCEVPDGTTYDHFMCNGVVINHKENEDLREEAVVERIIAYGDVGEQLDMQYRDALNGTTEWKDHVANVKATVTNPSSISAFVQDNKKIQLEGRNAWDPWVDNWTPP